LAQCSYTSEYYDYDTGRREPYKCPDEEYSDGLCKFHHSRYYAADEKNKEQVTEFLKQEVERANTSGITFEMDWLSDSTRVRYPL
jgi:hypothetical protein